MRFGINKREGERDSNPDLSDQLLPKSSSVLGLSDTKTKFCTDCA